MAVPDFQTLMRPLLVVLADGEDHAIKSVRAELAAHFSLTTEELSEEIPSGRAKTFQNRVGWATTYLYRTKLIERPKRSVYRITDRGREVLEKHPQRVDLKVLAGFSEFDDFRQSGKSAGGHEPEPAPGSGGSGSSQTAEERIEGAHGEIRSALAADLLDRIMEKSPAFFERVVLDVLFAMGYGGIRENVTQLGQTGDQGVDGVIREDRLGLDLIYVQAKRWENPIGRPEIQKFVGALQGQNAAKGVFITTSAFSAGAREYAETVSSRIILIDGKDLAQHMITYDVGVSGVKQYSVKRVDLDYFVTEEDEEVETPGSDGAGREVALPEETAASDTPGDPSA